jgi:hypothetical protein
MKETCIPSLRTSMLREWRVTRTIVLQARSFTCKPESLVHGGPQVLGVSRNKRSRPIGVRATEERVRMPAFEMERDRIRNRCVWVHGSEDFHDFGLNIRILHALDAQREITLNIVRISEGSA